MPKFTIRYLFQMEDGQQDTFALELDEETLIAEVQLPSDLPDWTLLEVDQCPNCPLAAAEGVRCPAAVNMVGLVERFSDLLSHDETQVEVETVDRLVFRKTTIQRGVCSLLGLLMATSACPRTDFFKPMARFHLPFASTAETIWRAASTYLLSQYFFKQDGGIPDVRFVGLRELYRHIQTVNYAFAKRLRRACQCDSMVNAVILLDMFAQSMPVAIDDSLEQIRPLFAAYLSNQGR